jgi:flagellar protein FlaG
MDVPAIASNNPPAAATAVASQSVSAHPVPPPAAAAGARGAEPTLGQVTDAVNAINRSMSTQSRGLEFSVDADSHRTIVKVVDRQTKELIRQIPTVETLEIAHALDQAQGLLIKQQA